METHGCSEVMTCIYSWNVIQLCDFIISHRKKFYIKLFIDIGEVRTSLWTPDKLLAEGEGYPHMGSGIGQWFSKYLRPQTILLK